MFSISESYFAELHNLGMSKVKSLRESFEASFPYSMEIMVDKAEYQRMVEDANELAGVGHPESINVYSCRNFQWSEYHPKNSHVYRNGAILLSTLVGFTHRIPAMQFKLKWFQS